MTPPKQTRADWMRENGIEVKPWHVKGLSFVAKQDEISATHCTEDEAINLLCAKIGLKMWEEKP